MSEFVHQISLTLTVWTDWETETKYRQYEGPTGDKILIESRSTAKGRSIKRYWHEENDVRKRITETQFEGLLRQL